MLGNTSGRLSWENTWCGWGPPTGKPDGSNASELQFRQSKKQKQNKTKVSEVYTKPDKWETRQF